MKKVLLKKLHAIKKEDIKIFQIVDKPQEVIEALSVLRGNARNSI